MAKNKKKRNKIYTGENAAITKPIITRIEASNRSKLHQWWFEHKKTLKPIIKTVLIAILVIIFVYEIIRIASGN